MSVIHARARAHYLNALLGTALLTLLLALGMPQLIAWASGGAGWAGQPPAAVRLLIAWLTSINLVTWLLWAADKAAARRGDFRVPEGALIMVSFLGGLPAACLAMRVLRHKSAKRAFLVRFWLTMSAWLLVAALAVVAAADDEPAAAARWPLDPSIPGHRPPPQVIECMTSVEVGYIDFDGVARRGVIIVNRDFADGVRAIFQELMALEFPIERIEPVSAYAWDDERSMRANNTSGYNYRQVTGGTNLSAHAVGCAIDLNPRWNPYVFPSQETLDRLRREGKADVSGEVKPAFRDEVFMFNADGSLDLTQVGAIHPRNGSYTRHYADQPGTIIAGTELGDAVIATFAEHGWTVWGGRWNSIRDWQHFQVPGCLRSAAPAPGERYCSLPGD